jgi:hypothetical protein
MPMFFNKNAAKIQHFFKTTKKKEKKIIICSASPPIFADFHRNLMYFFCVNLCKSAENRLLCIVIHRFSRIFTDLICFSLVPQDL